MHWLGQKINAPKKIQSALLRSLLNSRTQVSYMANIVCSSTYCPKWYRCAIKRYFLRSISSSSTTLITMLQTIKQFPKMETTWELIFVGILICIRYTYFQTNLRSSLTIFVYTIYMYLQFLHIETICKPWMSWEDV